MKNIYFIRQAQNEANTGGITKPNKEINLTSEGMLQAKKLLKILILSQQKFLRPDIIQLNKQRNHY